MFCPNCGSIIDDNASFCMQCGAPVGASQPEQQPVQPIVTEPALPMKWYKFLIYFSLFAGAVLNAVSGVTMLTGSVYGEYSTSIYNTFPALEPLNMILGIALIACAVFAIYVRFRLAGFYKDGPKMILVLYTVSLAISVINMIGNYMILPSQAYDITTYFPSFAISVAMVSANSTYFKKREHLFNK